MPNSLSDWFTSLAPGVVVLVAVVGTPIALWWERRRPSSFTRRPRPAGDALASWRAMSTAEQEAADNASLDMAAQAEDDAREAAAASAREVAQNLAERARVNALFHP